MDFKVWLGETKCRFATLQDHEKTEALQNLLDLCGSEQLSYLVQVYLPSTCIVDFFLKKLFVNYTEYMSNLNTKIDYMDIRF
jgi:hypothetical protein